MDRQVFSLKFLVFSLGLKRRHPDPDSYRGDSGSGLILLLSLIFLVFVAKIFLQYLFPLPGVDAVWYMSPVYENLRGHWFHNGFANQSSSYFLGYSYILTPFYLLLGGGKFFLFFFYDLLNVLTLFLLWKLLRKRFETKQLWAFLLLFLCTPIFWHYRPEQLIFCLFIGLFLVNEKFVPSVLFTVTLALVHPFAGLVAGWILVEENWRENRSKLFRIGLLAAVCYTLCILWAGQFVEVSESTDTLADMMQSRLQNFSLRNFVEFFKYSFPIVMFSLACLWGYLKANPRQWILIIVFSMLCLCMNKPYYFYYLDFYLLWKVSIHGQWPTAKWIYAPLLFAAFGINVAKPFYPYLFENGMQQSQQVHKILDKLESLSTEITDRQIHIPAEFAAPMLGNKNVRMLYYNANKPSFTTPPGKGDLVFVQHPHQVPELQHAYPGLQFDSAFLIDVEKDDEKRYCLIQLEVE